MRIIFALFLIMNLCFVGNSSASNSATERKILRIKENGELIEKQYLNSLYKPLAIIIYDTSSKQVSDSIVFHYGNYNTLDSVHVYKMEDGNYILDELPFTSNVYMNWHSENDCETVKLITQKHLPEKVLCNICHIENAVFHDSNIEQKKFELDGRIIISIKNINSRFRDFPLIIQSYFYNKKLKDIEFHISNGMLIQELYTFDTGTFEQTFLYNETLLEKSIISIKYIDNEDFGNEEKIVYTYDYEH